jgi:hypothetical protein
MPRTRQLQRSNTDHTGSNRPSGIHFGESYFLQAEGRKGILAVPMQKSLYDQEKLQLWKKQVMTVLLCCAVGGAYEWGMKGRKVEA